MDKSDEEDRLGKEVKTTDSTVSCSARLVSGVCDVCGLRERWRRPRLKYHLSYMQVQAVIKNDVHLNVKCVMQHMDWFPE